MTHFQAFKPATRLPLPNPHNLSPIYQVAVTSPSTSNLSMRATNAGNQTLNRSAKHTARRQIRLFESRFRPTPSQRCGRKHPPQEVIRAVALAHVGNDRIRASVASLKLCRSRNLKNQKMLKTLDILLWLHYRHQLFQRITLHH